jgi:hypothetical protein
MTSLRSGNDRPQPLDASTGERDLRAVQTSDDATTLLRIWGAHDESAWCEYPSLYSVATERLLRAGEPLAAFEVATEGLRYGQTDRRLRQLQGLALARSGAPERAIDVLSALTHDEAQTPVELEETLGMVGRVHKDLAGALTGPASVAQYGLAHEAYLRAYRVSGGSYSGVNAATTALLADKRETSLALAREVIPLARGEAERVVEAGGDAYWALATVAEALLVTGDEVQALDWYGRAAAAAKHRLGDIASTRRNARLIVEATGRGAAVLETALRVPRVASFVVAVASADGGPPVALSREQTNHLARVLDEHDVGIGFSSAAAGGEILFLEAVAARRGQTRIVLPYNADEFIADRVMPAGGDSWRPRFDRVLAGADEVVVATERRFARSTKLQDYADQLLIGLACTQSGMLDTELVAFVGIDAGGQEADARRWMDQLRAGGHIAELIDLRPTMAASTRSLAADVRSAPPNDSKLPRDDTTAHWGSDTRILGILFADVVNSGLLTDEQQPLMVEHFMGAIGRLCRSSINAPFWKNTWGDGMYFVFETTASAGQFALELRDLVTSTDWTQVGLRAGLTLRIGLHAGPIFSYTDPITGYLNFTGRHTIRGARIEPVTLPGKVYASREFAALATAAGDRAFRCTPVGRVTLAKHAAVTALFALDWRDAEARR